MLFLLSLMSTEKNISLRGPVLLAAVHHNDYSVAATSNTPGAVVLLYDFSPLSYVLIQNIA
jgi:hypothetical protein